MQIIPFLAVFLATGTLNGVSARQRNDDRDLENYDSKFAGAVYAMTNKFDGNTIVAYGRKADGKLELFDERNTGGDGANFDGGEGLDPLISANSLHVTKPIDYVTEESANVNNNEGVKKRFLLAVNAGSNSVTSFLVKPNWRLQRTSQVAVPCVGPNSITSYGNLIYVSCVDADGDFTGEPDQEGSITGFHLNNKGKLNMIRRSTRLLNNRPSDVHFSPDGLYLLVAGLNAGSMALPNEDHEEISVYRVHPFGRLSESAIDYAASTPLNNAGGRNLPTAVGFDVIKSNGKQFVVVSEAREFQSNGAPPVFDLLQTGSVSTWELTYNGRLVPIKLDVMTGDSATDGERTGCWLAFSKDHAYFWVANAIEATISSFRFNRDNGAITIIEEIAASGTGPAEGAGPQEQFETTDGFIDMQTSDDGKYLYQLYGLSGTVGAFKIDSEDGSLTKIQEVSDLPEENTQGIVAI